MNKKTGITILIITAVLLASSNVCRGEDAKRKDSANTKSKLQSMIERIRMANIEKKALENQIDSIAEMEPEEEPSEKEETQPQTTPEVHQSNQDSTITGEHPGSELTQETLKKIQTLATDPLNAKHPELVAEILYECGRMNEAYVFYKETLRRIDEDPASVGAHKDWVLLQTANCIRKNNKTEAIELYKRLLNEVPGSDWVGLARTQVKLLSWYVDNQVEELITGPIETETEL